MSNHRCFIVNVYSKGSLAEKRTTWRRLVHLKDYLGGENWCVVGDFNSVLSTIERRGITGDVSRRFNAEIRDFNNFVGEMGLLDLPLL
ncbi:hypothetical protein A2U01_0060935, partial [Trifolium medium]|nr:hypothetical protein [Trifolium medium]